MSKQNIRIKKTEGDPESAEVLASAIVTIASAFEKLLSTNLRERAIVQLLIGMPGMSGVTKFQIRLILDNLQRIKGWYVRE